MTASRSRTALYQYCRGTAACYFMINLQTAHFAISLPSSRFENRRVMGIMLSGSIRAVRVAMVALLALSAYAAAAQAVVRSIHIQAGWGGLGPPRHFAMTTRNENEVYHCKGTRVYATPTVSSAPKLEQPSARHEREDVASRDRTKRL